MIDQFIYPVWYRATQKIVDLLHARNVQAWHVSCLGVGAVMLAALLVFFNHTYSAIVFLLLSRIADGLDGPLARKGTPKPLGALIDNVADFICYGLLVAAFTLARSENTVPGIALLLSFYLSGGSFLAIAAIAAKRPATKVKNGKEQKKGFFYDHGLMEGAETIGFFIAFMLFPDFFPVLAWIFAFLCLVTITIRLWQVKHWET